MYSRGAVDVYLLLKAATPCLTQSLHWLSVSADTKTSGLMWMQPRIWEATMAFYFDYKQVTRVLPVDEIMTNAFNPGLVVN